MPSDQTSTLIPPPNPSPVGTSEWYYNEIMRQIEPDLLTTVIPLHTEKYKDESQAARTERVHKYDQAFMIFDKVAADFEQRLHADLDAARKKARKGVKAEEKREKKREKRTLKNIEHQIEQ